MTVERVLIMGAAGRDFHTFHTYFRNHPSYEVVAFTAAQIPGIADRQYPPALSGARYPHGIPIYPEEQLETLIHREYIQQVIFAYSDVSHLSGHAPGVSRPSLRLSAKFRRDYTAFATSDEWRRAGQTRWRCGGGSRNLLPTADTD